MPTRAHKKSLENRIDELIGSIPYVMVTERRALTLISIDDMTVVENFKRETRYPAYHAARVVVDSDELQAIADSYVKRGKSNGST